MAASDASTAPGINSSRSLIQSLLALPELRMRVLWLEDRIFSRPLCDVAPVLNEVTEQAQSTNRRAREAMISVAVFLARKRDSALVWALREESRVQALLSLERLLRDRTEKGPPDIEIEPRVPDYRTGRELTLGERKSLARRPSRLEIERLLHDPHPHVLEQLLQSPSLTEDDVLRIVTRRPAHVVALDLLVNSARWMARPRVRLSLILNPGTPHGLAMPLVSTCPRDDLALIIGTTNLSKTIRAVAHELYSRLPPVQQREAHPQHH